MHATKIPNTMHVIWSDDKDFALCLSFKFVVAENALDGAGRTDGVGCRLGADDDATGGGEDGSCTRKLVKRASPAFSMDVCSFCWNDKLCVCTSISTRLFSLSISMLMCKYATWSEPLRDDDTTTRFILFSFTFHKEEKIDLYFCMWVRR